MSSWNSHTRANASPSAQRYPFSSSTSSSAASTPSIPAADEWIALRVQHLLPYSVQQAELRLAELKQLFLFPRDSVYGAYRYAVENYVQRQQLLQHVRNLKVIDLSNDTSSVAHRSAHELIGEESARCFPFTACAGLSCGSHFLVTGACDGLLTLWDTEASWPLASHPGNQRVPSFPQACYPAGELANETTLYGGGRGANTDHDPPDMGNPSTSDRPNGTLKEKLEGKGKDDNDDMEGGGGLAPVKAIVSHPVAPLFFSRTMFDPVIRGWKVSCEEGRTVEETARELKREKQEAAEERGEGNKRGRKGHSSLSNSIQLLPVCSLQMRSMRCSESSGVAEGSALVRPPPSRRLEGSHPKQNLAIDSSGLLVASGGPNGIVRVWDIRGVVGEVQGDGSNMAAASSYASPYSSFGMDAMSPHRSGTSLSASTSFSRCPPVVQWWDSAEYRGAGGASSSSRGIFAIAFHPDGALLSTGSAGGRLVTWDLRSGRVAFHTALHNRLSAPHRLQGSDHSSLRCRPPAHLHSITCLAWSHCGQRFATGGTDGVVHCWDARQLHRVCNSTSLTGTSSSHANNNNNNNSATSSSSTGFDSLSNAASHSLVGHEDEITSLSFCPCPSVFFKDNPGGVSVLGRRLPLAVVTTSLDHTIRWWDMNTGVCVKVVRAEGPVRGHTWIHGGAQDGSLITIVHGKSWSLWGVGDRSAGSTYRTDGKEKSMNASFQTVETTEVVHVAPRTYPVNGVGSDSNTEEDEEEEDEMKALQRATTLLHRVPKSSPKEEGNANNNSYDDEVEEENEMAMLMR